MLKILELQPEHVQDITDGFTLNLIALVGTWRFMQFCDDTIDGIAVNTSHTLHDIVPYCRHHTEIPTRNRVLVLHFFLPLFQLEYYLRSQSNRLVLVGNFIATAVGAGNSSGRTDIIDIRAKNLSEFKFKAVTVPLNRAKQIIIVQCLTGPLNSQCCIIGQVIDIFHGRHVGVTITKSLYGYIYGFEKSVEDLPEGLIFNIHDRGLDMVIQIEIRKDGLVNDCNQSSLKTH